MHTRNMRLVALLGIFPLLAGCASLSRDGGLDDVNRLTKQRLNAEVPATRTDAETSAANALAQTLLAQPLTMESAVNIALLNNSGLRATYAELGIAEAELVQASRLSNPVFDYKHASGSGGVSIERTLTFNLAQLITLPLAKRMEKRRFEQVKLQVANETFAVATEARKAFIEAVAARQGVAYAQDVSVAAEASAELAEKMQRAGNWSRLEQAREQVFRAESQAGLMRMKNLDVSAREKLARILGANTADLHLPERLPELPTALPALNNAEELAMQSRLDILSAKQETAALAESLGLNKTTRFINVLDLGAVRNTDSGTPRASGYEISISIPLFDWGDARVARAEAIYMQSVHRLAQRAVNARSEVRESYQRLQSSYAVAKQYRDDIVPLRKKISEEHQLRYNGMLISVFELLADARDQVAGVNGYINALKDYWLADADLQAALGGNMPAAMKGTQP